MFFNFFYVYSNKLVVARIRVDPGFLASYWSTGFGRFLQVSAHWLEDCENFIPTPEGPIQYSANHS
jgi:hypothetical protein